MPAKRTTSKTKRSQAAPKKASNRKFVIGIFAVVSLLFVGLFFYWILNNAGGGMGEQAKMASYLKDKYGKEFIVEGYRVEGSGLGVEGDPTADAYPKDNSHLKFEVWDRGKFHNDNHAYSDNYINAVWSKEQTQIMSNSVSQIFGYTPDYKATIGFNGTLDNNRDIPDLSEATPKLSKNLSLGLVVHPKERIEESSKSLHSQRVFELINLLKSSDVDRLTLTYGADNGTGGTYLENDELRNIRSAEEVLPLIKEQR